VLLIFFLIVVTTILFFFISNAFKDGTIPEVALATKAANGGGSPDYKLSMVRNIREDVHVGVPPFGSDTNMVDVIDDSV
jgi:hypothetical protein